MPLHLWEARREELLARREPLGIWLDSSEHPEALADALAHLQLVAINFPVFSDGRGYSCARLLREKYGFTGELRAIGDVLRDQLFLMRRCGFDSFEIRADRDAADALAGLGDFTHVYQCATVDPGRRCCCARAQGGDAGPRRRLSYTGRDSTRGRNGCRGPRRRYRGAGAGAPARRRMRAPARR